MFTIAPKESKVQPVFKWGVVLRQWLPRHGPQTDSISNSWKLIRLANPKIPNGLAE